MIDLEEERRRVPENRQRKRKAKQAALVVD